MKPRYRLLLTLIVISLGVTSLLTACGQTGPLYLPDQSEQQE